MNGFPCGTDLTYEVRYNWFKIPPIEGCKRKEGKVGSISNVDLGFHTVPQTVQAPLPFSKWHEQCVFVHTHGSQALIALYLLHVDRAGTNCVVIIFNDTVIADRRLSAAAVENAEEVRICHQIGYGQHSLQTLAGWTSNRHGDLIPATHYPPDNM